MASEIQDELPTETKKIRENGKRKQPSAVLEAENTHKINLMRKTSREIESDLSENKHEEVIDGSKITVGPQKIPVITLFDERPDKTVEDYNYSVMIAISFSLAVITGFLLGVMLSYKFLVFCIMTLLFLLALIFSPKVTDYAISSMMISIQIFYNNLRHITENKFRNCKNL